MPMSAFAMSLISPVFYKSLCGSFKEGLEKRLELDDVKVETFSKLIRLVSGADTVGARSLVEIVDLAKLADRFQITEARKMLEDVILRNVSLQTCADLLNACQNSGLTCIEKRCYSLAVAEFSEFANTKGFLSLNRNSLHDLLNEDELSVNGEEEVFEAVLRWTQAQTDIADSRELLHKVRYSTMSSEYYSSKVLPVLRDHDEWKKQNATASKDISSSYGNAALSPSKPRGVCWEQYVDGGEHRLNLHSCGVDALVEHQGFICSGAQDGMIGVWNKQTLQAEASAEDLAGAYCLSEVSALTSWGKRLVSGHHNGQVRIYEVKQSSFGCQIKLQQVLHTQPKFSDVTGLATSTLESRLIAGFNDGIVHIWSTDSDGSSTRLERTLSLQSQCLIVWQDKLITGSRCSKLRVCDLNSEGALCEYENHSANIQALANSTRYLFCGSQDGMISVWSLGQWSLIRRFQAFASVKHAYVNIRLGASNGKLVIGSFSESSSFTPNDMKVWDIETMACEHSIPTKGKEGVRALLVCRSQVWAGIDNKVVVWGPVAKPRLSA